MDGQKNLPTHCLLLVLVAGYILWMAYQIPRNVQTGVSSMTMETAWVLAAVMALAGAAVLGYSAWLWFRKKK